MIFAKTDRLILRTVRSSDVPSIFDYRNGEPCLEFQRGQERSLEKIGELVNLHSDDPLGVACDCMIAVALKSTDELIGEIQVMPTDGTISLGYRSMGYLAKRDSLIFGKWLTAESEREIAEAVEA